MTTQRFTAWALAVAVAMFLQGALVDSALAQIFRTYRVTHNFTLTPGGSVLPSVTGSYYAHAWAREGGPSCSDWDVTPGGQPGGWGAYGRDRLRSKARVLNSGNGGGNVWAAIGLVNIPPGGFGPATYTAATTGCLSAGNANSRITVNPYGAGTPVTGQIRSFGSALATLASGSRWSRAYAFSMTSVRAQGRTPMANGTIVWGPVVRDVVSGSASRTTRQRRWQQDPIEFVVEDLDTGKVIEGTLLSIDVESFLEGEEGGFVWENDEVTIDDGANVTFVIDQTSPHVSPNGALQLVVQGGVVTQSEDSGVYDGVLPTVGTPTPLTFPLINEIQVDYDLGDFGGHDLDVSLDLHGSGEAEIENGFMLPWAESFDDYVTGSSMHAEGGWKGWNGDPAFDASVTDVQARSTANALDVVGTGDLMHEFVGADSGQWTFTAWQYGNPDFPDDSFFILLNTYNDGGPYNWSTQLRFDGSSQVVRSEFDGAELPLITDQWVELRVDVDLDADSQSIYYGGDLLTTKSWTDGVTGDGALNIGAVDLCANGSASVYYDDLSLVSAEPECPGDIDGDGDTDHSDLGELLAAWCTHDGDPSWNPDADLDGDGHVGHGDLGILLADWGCAT